MRAGTLNQLGEMDKPAGLLDVEGYSQPFMGFIDDMTGRGFLPAAHRGGVVVSPVPVALLDGLAAHQRVTVPNWM